MITPRYCSITPCPDDPLPTPLASSVWVDPKDGSQQFGQWQLFGVGQSLVGAAITVAST
jgi:hypothetical protein